ncbi:hypothetical protein [Alkalicoccus saliphilus]|jgi:hypothetical protein|uniref:Uncharacterized protein n=1 Tax=Alkalicoccus saliphilus TaxID=200989 RepID=A0A2T4U9N9_9BACI|nr:hypothetical protein [Alkalicoccus saliphilus]PTL40118.1 hypothetical protein C6Y45_01690 [Alkalicoccus saliphilus]
MIVNIGMLINIVFSIGLIIVMYYLLFKIKNNSEEQVNQNTQIIYQLTKLREEIKAGNEKGK